jgi:hypothetical protein
MPICERCHAEIPTGDAECPACDERDANLAAEAYEDFLRYDGDEYFTRGFVEDGQSEEEARLEVQDPRFIQLCLEFGGLEYILKDRWATKGLLDAILRPDKGVLASLQAYATERLAAGAVRGKPGPKPDPATGKYKYDQIVELRQQGYRSGQIALKVYGDPKKANRVLATLSRLRKRPPQQ